MHLRKKKEFVRILKMLSRLQSGTTHKELRENYRRNQMDSNKKNTEKIKQMKQNQATAFSTLQKRRLKI